MRVLLDECLPRRLKDDLIGHEVRTVPEMRWSGKRNGKLLRLAAREFDVFLTVDRRLPREQKLSTFRIAVIVLVARGNRLLDLLPLVPAILEILPRARLRRGGGRRWLIDTRAGDAPVQAQRST